MINALLVDDDTELSELTRVYFGDSSDIRISTASHVQSALSMHTEHRYDVIVSDLKMPGMDGIELLKKIRGSGDTTPFILFTGSGREFAVIAALNQGADFYIRKGGDPQTQFAELDHAIRNACRRHHTEVALANSEYLQSEIIDFLPDATFAIDKNQRIIAWNKAIEKMTGVPSKEMIGRDSSAYAIAFYGKNRPLLANLVLEPATDIESLGYTGMKRDGPQLISETSAARPNGKDVTLWKIATPLYNDVGELSGAIESIRDITEFRHIRVTHQETQDKFRKLSNILPILYFEFDTSGKSRFANDISIELFGYTREEIEQGIELTEIICPSDLERAFAHIRRVYANELVSGADYTFIRRDGSELTLMVYITAIQGEAGKEPVGFRGLAIDNTERRMAEEAIFIAHRKLTLLYSITRHDVLNKLTVLQGYLDLLNQQLTDPVQKEFVAMGLGASETIRQQIAFTKDYEEVGVKTATWQSVNQTITTARYALGSSLEGPLIEIDPSVNGLSIYSDPLLQKVFLNLFENTVQHSGKKEPAIRIAMERNGSSLTISVADNGVGVPDEDKEQIFSRGFGKRTGFGLFLAREILTITGLGIRERGVPGKGANFEIIVPRGAYRIEPNRS